MKKIIYLIIFIMLSSIVLSDDLTFIRNQEIDLKIPCIINNTACSDSATCNITINYPNGSNLINNQLMTNNNIYHNFTLSKSDIIGDYYTLILCDDLGEKGYSTFYFTITNENLSSNNILSLIIGLGIVCFILLYFSVSLEEKHFLLRLLCIIFVFVLILLIPKSILYGSSTIDIFYKTVLWFLRLFFTYAFIYFIYEILIYKNIIKDFRK